MGTLVGRTVLGGLEVVREIGRGGYARVYEVRLGEKESAALKVLHPSYVEDARATARLFREALVTERARSPRVVQVYGVGTLEEGAPYVLMELLEGRSLAARIDAEGALDPQEAVRIAMEVAEGLGAAHEVGVVHRDVKPSNVFLVRGPDARETAKVLDFGISKLLPGAEDRFGALTKSGAILGTPRYLSPEQAASEQPTAAADQYALGVTLYEMLSGRVPYDVVNVAQGIADILTGRPTPLIDVAPSLDPSLAALVMRALRRDPAARFPSILALREALAPYATAAAPVARRGESGEAFASTLGLDVVALQTLHGDVLPRARAARVGLRPEPAPPSSTWSQTAPVVAAAVASAPRAPRIPAAARARTPASARPVAPALEPRRAPRRAAARSRAAPVDSAARPRPEAAPRGRRLLTVALMIIGLLSVLVAALIVGALFLFSDGRPATARVGPGAPPPPGSSYDPDRSDPDDPRPVLREAEAGGLRSRVSHWDECVRETHRYQDTGRNLELRIWCASQGHLTDELAASCRLYVARWPAAWIPTQCHAPLRDDPR